MTRAGIVLVLLLTWAAPVRAQVDTDPPAASTETIRSLTEITFRFDEDVIGVTTSNVVVGLPGGPLLTGRLLCLPPGGTTPVSCASGGARTVRFIPSSPVIIGETYEAKVNPDGVVPQVTDEAGNAAPAYRRLLRAPSVAEERAGPTYRWRRFAASAAGDDVYVAERRAGARAIYRFTGTAVTWITVFGPDQGIAGVYVDNVRVATIDTGASSRRFRVGRTFSGLADRAHTIVIRAEGRAGRGRNAWVAVDGFRTAAGGTVSETAAAFQWAFVRDAAASSDAYADTPTPGAAADLRFRGRGVDWITHVGPDQGIAKVFIDGRHVRTFDNYAPTRRYGVRRTITNLTDAQHRLAVIGTGTRNRASRGTQIRVDAFVLRAATVDFRGLGAWVDLWDYTDSGAIFKRWDGVGWVNRNLSFASAAQLFEDKGVRTIYLQTGRYNTDAFHRPAGVRRWLEEATARGIKVVGWHIPSYDEAILGEEIAKTAAIASYRAPGGQRFAGLAIDIEYWWDRDKERHLTAAEWMSGITKHLRSVRSRVGVSYPIGAITFAPLDMDINPSWWDTFPWASVARYADVAIPMSYWTNRYNRCDGAGSFDPNPRYCVSGYTAENVRRTRALTGLPVHIAGGVTNIRRLGSTEVRSFVAAARAERASGGSLYDAAYSESGEWTEMAGMNAL